jgi:hypothetical protein
MSAKKVHERVKAAPAGYTYAEVETAIARVLQIDSGAQGGFLRGRIQHLRRLGLTPSPTATGGPIPYSPDWAARWLLALRLERLGLTPTAVVEFIQENWERRPGAKLSVTSLRQVIEDARAVRKGDTFLTVRFDEFGPAFPQIGRINPYWKPHPTFDNAKGFFDWSASDAADVVVIPLSEVLRLLDKELLDERAAGDDGGRKRK